MRDTAGLGIAIWLLATAVAGQGSAPSSRELDLEQLYAVLNEQRSSLELGSLRRDTRLEVAAQKLVDESVARQFFDLNTPDGKQLAQWVSDERYQLGRVTGKIAEANLRVAEIAAGWVKSAKRNRDSLFHPQMRDVGVGWAKLGDRNRLVVILAITDADYVLERAQQLLDADAIESQFGADLNALREQAQRKPMRAHPALRKAAGELANEVLEFQLDPDAERRAYSMARRIRRAGYRMREALELQAVGPTSVEELVEFWFRDAESQQVLLRKFFTEFGLAVEVGETEDGPTVVWVLSVGRPGSV